VGGVKRPRKIDSPAFRRARAGLAGATAHIKDPDLARRAGSMGGRKTAGRFAEGPSNWGKRLALARWHQVPFEYATRDDRAGQRGS
jgi:hypothetical protein